MIETLEKTIFATILAVLFGLGTYWAGLNAISEVSHAPVILGLIGTIFGAGFGWLLAKWRIEYLPVKGIEGVILRLLGMY